MTSNAPGSTYEDTVGTTTVRWPRVYNPVIGLGCPVELGGCGAIPGNLCTRAASLVEEARRGLRRVNKRCPCAARIKLASPGLWPELPEPPTPRPAESGAEPVESVA